LGWIEPGHERLPLRRQCELAGVPRATVYRRIDAASRQACEDESDLALRALIDEEYTSRPFYGSRRMVVFLRAAGHVVNRKRVQRLMRTMGLAGMAPGPNTSRAHPRHTVYPYLLRGVPVTRPNLKGDANMAELTVGLAQYFALYNAERPHQSLGYQTPGQVYRDGIGGGALIVDRFGDDGETAQEKSRTGQRRATDAVELGTA
jgi:hypothetical protein